MRARSSFTAQGRRAQIVAATVHVIAHEGLAKASFGRIAKAAKLSSPGMISYHFADKDELLTILCDTVLDDCVRTIESAVAAAPGPAAGLAAYLRGFVHWQDEHRAEVAALWRLAAGWKRPGADAAFDEGRLRAPLMRILTEGRASGELRDLNPDWAARTILCSVESYQQARAVDPDLDPEVFAADLVELFTRGLLP